MLPEGWKRVPLASIIQRDRKITYGIVQPGGFVEQGVVLVRGGDYSTGWVPLSQIKRVRPEIDAPYKRSKLRPGDILLTIVGANTGTIAIVPSWLDGANITQTTARIAIDETKADRSFVAQVLKSDWGQDEVHKYVKGAAQPGLNLEDVALFTLPLPPLPEQRRIAAVLGAWDSAIATAERLVGTRRDAKTIIASKAFEEASYDDQTALGDFCRPRQWPTPGRDGMIGGDVPVFGANGRIGFIDRPTHVETTIAVGCRGSVGEVHRIGGPAYITGNAMALDELDEQRLRLPYLYHFLQHFGFDDIVSGTSQPQITQGDMRRKMVWVPSLNEQDTISAALDLGDVLVEQTLALVGLLRQQKRGLMQLLLTGKLRVPESIDALMPSAPALEAAA